jgi:glycosyltransferase involved in cell wall biosynthesis
MDNRKKICFVVSGVNFSLGFLWLAQHLDTNRFSAHFIWLNKTEPEMQLELTKLGISTTYLHTSSKYHYPIVFFRLLAKFILKRPSIVHAHLFEAGFLAMPAAFIAGVRKRFYTRHYATYHAEYFPYMVKYDRFINYLSTDIVSISNNVTSVLVKKEKLPPEKIHTIPHGFDLGVFSTIEQPRVQRIREKYSIPDNHHPVIGVISRFVELKGIQYIVPAFIEFRKSYPDAHLVLANTVGNYAKEIDGLTNEIPSSHLSLIRFEKDLPALYHVFDQFIHVPINSEVEAFGQVYVEALAAGIPSIFTLSGIARDFVKDRENALVVPFQDSHAILNAMLELEKSQLLCNRIIEKGKKDVQDLFRLDQMVTKLQEVYG